jgi:hypothetical protein
LSKKGLDVGKMAQVGGILALSFFLPFCALFLSFLGIKLSLASWFSLDIQLGEVKGV